MNIRRSFLLALLSFIAASLPASATTVGLSSSAVNPIYAEQRQSEWCWAACIQMITNLYGADLTQEEVVARTYGPGVNRAGTLDVITATLNGSGTTRHGRQYHLASQMLTNTELPAALVAELTAGHPMMLGCDAGGSGHAVVCTAVSYEGDASHPTITLLTIRDPWPSGSNHAGAGRQVLRGDDLGPRILEGWVIHVCVCEADGTFVPAPQGYVFDDTDSTLEHIPNASPDLFSAPRPQRPLVANDRPITQRDEDDPRSTPHPLVEAASGLVNLMESLLTTR